MFSTIKEQKTKENKFEAKRKKLKFVAAFLLICIINQVVFPTAAMALTNGPTQPTAMSFEPVTTNQMVDLATGDFTYNIPLFELPGPNGSYPFNLFYNSNVTMDQEASMYGLGWNLNPGMINKNQRGIDDFADGETSKIKETVSMKDNWTVGGTFGKKFELWSLDPKKYTRKILGLNMSLGGSIYYNSYKGVGAGINTGFTIAHRASSPGDVINLGLNFGVDSQNGSTLGTSLSYARKPRDFSNKYSLGIGLSSKRGLDLSSNYSGSKFRNMFTGKGFTSKEKKMTGSISGGASYSFANSSFNPVVNNEMRSLNLSFSIAAGVYAPATLTGMSFNGFYSHQWLLNKGKEKEINTVGYNYLHNSDGEKLADFSREKDQTLHKHSKNIGNTQFSHDTYLVKGQGIGMSFRPYRSDIGHVNNKKFKTHGGGAKYNIEFGAGAGGRIGQGGGANYNISTSGAWDNNKNKLKDTWEFQPNKNGAANLNYEPVYYKAHGEPTTMLQEELDYFGNDLPVRAKLDVNKLGVARTYHLDETKLVNNEEQQVETVSTRVDARNKNREDRNSNIQEIKNRELYQLINEGIFSADYLPHDATSFTSGFDSGERLNKVGSISGAISTNISNHAGAFSITNPSGLRYNYGIPVYNLAKVEEIASVEALNQCAYKYDITSTTFTKNVIESINKSEEYHKKTVYPAEVQNYLLTNILGTDYVDVDGTPGPSDGDYGYWVKFNYQKDHDYLWRAPYTDAMYSPGSLLTGSDDKASYTFGERENYYLKTAETETHIAVFTMSERHDARGAASQYADGSESRTAGATMQKVDRIDLYVKQDYINDPVNATPLQSTHFRYSYELCKGVLNNDHLPYDHDNDASTNKISNETGKLTLKKVWTTYQTNNRGSLSPYVFNYGDLTKQDNNPNYDEDSYNRWGGYKDYSGDYCNNIQDPYVSQFEGGHNVDEDGDGDVEDGTFNPELSKEQHRQKLDKWAGAWSLKKITLPSGGDINIEYESDDYGYVQHKRAAQMFKIVGTGHDNATTGTLYFNKDNSDHTKWKKTSKTGNTNYRKIYFELEQPVLVEAGGLSTDDQDDFKRNYIEPLRVPGKHKKYQVYVNAWVNIRANFGDYVSGFMEIDPTQCGIDQSTTETLGDDEYYTRGYVMLEPIESTYWLQTSKKYYHPISFLAWQQVQRVKPEIITAISTDADDGNITEMNKKEKALHIRSFMGSLMEAGQMFKSFHKQCFQRKDGLANEIDLNKSWIRIGTPDRKKLGGGSRVKKVYLTDNWGETDPEFNNDELVYGQVYSYTTKDPETNEEYSSGVAAYEPMIGANENILRYAKISNNKQFGQASSVDNFLYPVNENLYPGAAVTYSKVTTKSIGTQKVMDNGAKAKPNQKVKNRAVSGLKVNEFYTYKDFPVIASETALEFSKEGNGSKDFFNRPIPIPFIGMIRNSKMAASQGYSIELNDMNGKVKAEKTYAINADGSIGEKVTGVEYEYQKTPVVYENENVFRLDNNVTTVKDNLIISSSDATKYEYEKTQKLLGVEYDIYPDFRSSSSTSVSGGAQFNCGISGFIFEVTWFPEMDYSNYELRTAVINKKIHKSGILKSTTATDGQSNVKTENVLYDDLTGSVVLTKVKNNFEDDIYSMNIPAHWKYDGMGAASENSGVEFHVHGELSSGFRIDEIEIEDLGNGSYTTVPHTSTNNPLKIGDEVIIDFTSLDQSYFGVVSSLNSIALKDYPVTRDVYANERAKITVFRSAKRNLLNAVAGNLVALDNPTNKLRKETLLITDVPNVWKIELRSFLNENLAEGGILTPGLFTNFAKGSFLESVLESIEVKDLAVPYTLGQVSIPGVSKGDIIFNSKNGGVCTMSINMPIGAVVEFYIDDEDRFGYRTETIEGQFLGGGAGIISNIIRCLHKNIEEKYANNVLQASAVEFSNTWDYGMDLGLESEYFTGEKGIWRVSQNHYYKDERISSNEKHQYASTDVNLKEDGVFKGDLDQSTAKYNKMFRMFDWSNATSNGAKWIPNEQITKYNRDGFAVESKDILGNYSFAKYGYGGNLVTMVGANAQENEVFFEDFETTPVGVNSVSSSQGAHSGKNSRILGVSGGTTSLANVNFIPSKKYVLTCWISDLGQVQNKSTYTIDGLTLSSSIGTWTENSATIKALPTGKIINGWQKIEVVFTVPSNHAGDEVTINYPSANIQYDDVRICPFKSAVKTYVYDPTTFRLVAELDNNHYSTFYFYDTQGSLHLTKVETSEGILTVSESRGHVKEQD